MSFSKILIGIKLYVKLSSWYDICDYMEAKKLYPNFHRKVVSGDILAVDDDRQQIFISFPALLSSCWKSISYLKEKYVFQKLKPKLSLFLLEEFLAAERKLMTTLDNHHERIEFQ